MFCFLFVFLNVVIVTIQVNSIFFKHKKYTTKQESLAISRWLPKGLQSYIWLLSLAGIANEWCGLVKPWGLNQSQSSVLIYLTIFSPLGTFPTAIGMCKINGIMQNSPDKTPPTIRCHPHDVWASDSLQLVLWKTLAFQEGTRENQPSLCSLYVY